MRINNWGIFAFIAGYHALLLGFLPYWLPLASGPAFALWGVTFAISGLSITAGYHRLFAHRAFKAKPVYEWAVLLGSCLAVQASALRWSHDHRLHHTHVDTDKDPYSVKKGFWHAHVWWLFVYQAPINTRVVGDLLKNPRVAFQDRHYVLLTLAVNAAVFGVGCLFLSPLASLFYGVVLRVFAIHHSTWFINSLAHMWGARTYSRELSAVDNAVIALLTFGEGYHNYHHAIATDYRNGIRWYHFDPTKWLIWTCSKLGLATDLRWADDVRIRQILVRKDIGLLEARLGAGLDETTAEICRRLKEIAAAFEEKASRLLSQLRTWREATGERRRLVTIEIRQLQRELHALWRSWTDLMRLGERQLGLAA